MQIRLNLIIIFACTFFVGCGTQRAVNAPLLFYLESKDGTKSCLMASSHVAITPSSESKELIDCIKHAKAYAFESNILETPKFFPQILTRNSEEISYSDLSLTTREKIKPALRELQYTEADIDYILQLHPVGIYRALTHAKKLEPEVQLVPNLDIAIAQSVIAKKVKYIELEGITELSKSERRISLDQLNELITIMCDLVLDAAKFAAYKIEINKYAQSLNALPNIESGWNLQFHFNTKMLGLPAYSVTHEVDNRNALIGANMLKAMKENGSVMMFVGAAHVGGPASVLKVLEQAGIRVERIQ